MPDRLIIRLLVALGFAATVLFSIVLNEMVAADQDLGEIETSVTATPD